MVDLHQTDTGGIERAADDRGVGAGRERGEDR